MRPRTVRRSPGLSPPAAASSARAAELCGVPVDGAHGGGSVGVLQFGRGAAEPSWMRSMAPLRHRSAETVMDGTVTLVL